jgi:hypothetical protein
MTPLYSTRNCQNSFMKKVERGRHSKTRYTAEARAERRALLSAIREL